MSDISATYTLVTPGGTIIFNDGTLSDGTDKYWLSNIEGLDSPALRTPIDNAPQADGGLVHDFWKGPRHIVFEGTLVTESVGFPGVGPECLEKQNEMEDDLMTALETILRSDGALSWTPLGLGARSLTVRYEVGLDFSKSDDYKLSQFVFGLVAGDPDW